MKKMAKIGILMVLLAFAVTACATGGINTPLPQTDTGLSTWGNLKKIE
ncbi:MAG: hypothetical protein GW872_01210 [Nitrospirae bacterium]|nr:hypothetical protein [Nitrospirota bacterium]